ncbi:CpsD/CapB family tyrosine-protein kinase [Streptococcaceae bacterium ESL0687]|nr:CpsD/CapB family tyrosine-protein kinase [Streptococcaceae bacterium ESL0687]WEV60769.1 CpsD/CapB family tyrosine-protein kinase [Streptococcaceae bacterium ESL0729]
MAKKDRKKQKTQGVSLITLMDKSSPISEQYRTIRTNIQFASTVNNEIKTIVMTSSGPSEGKSTSSANLAVVFANSGQKVLLIDADMRKPTVAKTFMLPNVGGLSTTLTTSQGAMDVVQDSGIPNLSIMTSGPKPPNPSELLGSVRMNEILQEVRENFDFVIFDMPPVVAVTDAQIMSSKVDGTLMVVREGISRKDTLFKAKNLLQMVNANVLGVIYNGAKNTADQGYYYYGA